jgi:single-stranded DNA-specific DHH superfamily exonuclease
MQVLNLIERRENELQGAELDSESQQIQQEIEAQAVDLIQASGLTLQEYLQLLSLTNIDPEFGERVAAQLQEASD